MPSFTFQDPLWFIALLALGVVALLRRQRAVPVWLVPFAAAWHRPSLAAASRWPARLTYLGLALLIVALARPQKIEDRRLISAEGYDIMLAIDLSGSMLAEDYERGGQRINRLQAIKPVIQAFIQERRSDRIGIVLFAGRSYTLAPLTFDHDWLARQVGDLRIGRIEDGTAIGDGIGVALTRLEQAARVEGRRRQGAFVVLLTDGANNSGALSPMQAAELARARGIPVYTIGAGRDGLVPFPLIDPDSGRVMGYRRVLSDLDEGTLREIAAHTGGRYFKADDQRTINAAFAAIDAAEKIEFQARSHLITTELFAWTAGPGIAALLLATLLARRPPRPDLLTRLARA